MAFAGVVIGAALTTGGLSYYNPAMAGLCAFLVCASGNIVNDLLDVEIDRINRPNRVLVKGTVSIRLAWILAFILNLLAIANAAILGIAVAVAVVLAIVLLTIYNFKSKKIPLLGNVVIATLGGMTFLTGGLAVSSHSAFILPGPIIPACFAFLFHLVREIVKDAEDIVGDQALGIQTLPQLMGVKKALALAAAFYLMMVIVTVVPVVFGWYGLWYAVLAIGIVDLPGLGLIWYLWSDPTPKRLSLGSTLLKVGMGIGALSLILV